MKEEDPIIRINTLAELTESHHVWVICDIIQTFPRIESGNSHYDKAANRQPLTKNLRNTYDLSNVLSVIRDRLTELIQNKYDYNLPQDIVPPEITGHYIRGPKTVMHVLQNHNEELIHDILSKEMCQLWKEDMITTADIGIIYTTPDVDTLKVVERVSQSLNIIPEFLFSVISLEWPVVVVFLTLVENFYKFSGEKDLYFDIQHLYLAISRARVKCTVIMFPLEGFIFDGHKIMNDLLNKLENSVKIRRYPLTPLTYKPLTPLTYKPRSFAYGYFCEKFPEYFELWSRIKGRAS
jgi:hypothetical protein